MRKPARCAVLVYFALILGACGRGVEPRPSPVPRIEWAALDPSIVPRSPDLRTGYLVVPENRGSRSARSIRLPFVIIKSRSASPRPDPVLVSAGGPGGSILGRARNRARNPLLEDRDVILLEQRGCRFAEPSLTAPQIAEALRSGWGESLNGDPDPAAVERALADTLSEYKAMGIALDGYTTRESAADIAALRRLLNVGSWDLYGSSYSTKIMLTVLRDSPSGVRAVILDSVLPLEANWDEEALTNILDAWQRLITAARETATLRSRLVGFEARWEGFLKEANRQPLEIAVKDPVNGRPFSLRLDAAGVMNCVYAGLEDAAVIPRLPLIIDAACRGAEDVLAPLAEAYLSSSQGFAWGARLAVWCNEEFPFERPDRILKPPGLPAELARFVQTAVPLEALSTWPQGRPAARENRPVRSGVPALIAAGEFDPDTPVAWSRRTASFLPDSQLVVFAGMSHVPLFSHPEAGRIMREFLNSPRRRVDPGRTGVRPPFITESEDDPAAAGQRVPAPSVP